MPIIGSRKWRDGGNWVMIGQVLFFWVFVVSEYLRMSINPDARLKLLLSRQGPMGVSTGTTMDQTYSSILLDCNWDDEHFFKGYDLLMGTIVLQRHLCRHRLCNLLIVMMVCYCQSVTTFALSRPSLPAWRTTTHL
jgi:hypothetical protein